MAMEKEELGQKATKLNEDELEMVASGKGGYIDWSIEDESVPVNENDTCPRCKWGCMKIAQKSKYDFTPLYLVCSHQICGYMYTPDEWK